MKTWAWILLIATVCCTTCPISTLGQDALPDVLPGAPPQLNAPPSLPQLSPTGPPTSGATTTSPDTADTAPRVEYVTENGVRYRITRQVVRQPVQDVRYVDQPQTFYEQRLRTDAQQVNYYTQVPVTQYECVPRLYDWWRVVQGGYVAYGLEPYTTYQTQPQTTTVPITRREVRPVTKTVKVAVPQLRFEDRLVVRKERVDAVGSTTPNQPPLTPSYVPPPTVPQIYGQPPSVPQLSVPPGISPRSNFPPSNFPTTGSTTPRDPNPFGGFGVAAPISGGSTGATYIPPSAAAPSNPQVNSTRGSTDTSRYGGVARFDGDPPRYGTGSIERR